MKNSESAKPAHFGEVIGIAPGNVPIFSSDYDSIDDREMPNRLSFKSIQDGITMGHKWQCVEIARRWLYINRGYIFDDVPMAYDIFKLRQMNRSVSLIRLTRSGIIHRVWSTSC